LSRPFYAFHLASMAAQGVIANAADDEIDLGSVAARGRLRLRMLEQFSRMDD
jgi:hypothetical protein